MKKVITIDAIFTSFIGAMGYGFGMVIPSAYGLNPMICFIISMVLGTIADTVSNKIVFSRKVQESNQKRYVVFGIIAVLFVLGYLYLFKYFAYSLWSDLSSALIFSTVLPIVFFVLALGVEVIKRKKLLEKYGTGEGGFQFDKDIEKEWADVLGKNAKLDEYTGKNPQVKTYGGTYVGKSDRYGARFLGIPYAKAPTGANRWKKPIPVDASDNIYEAYYFGNSEIQPKSEHNILNRFYQDEDCLNLNIWTAKFEPEGKKPVLVYFHGGDGRYGGSVNPLYYLNNIAKNIPDAVFVSINYRIGIFGVVSFDASAREGSDEYKDSTALSLFDQIEALKWVKNNIAAFGGDPLNITVAGDNSGGNNICQLSVMKEAKGLFKRAIVMCASIFDAPQSSENAEEAGKLLLEEFKATKVSELEKVTSEQLREFTGKHYETLELPPCDGNVVPVDAVSEYLKGAASDVEFIFGIAADDVSGWQAIIADEASLDAMTESYYELLKSGLSADKAVKLDEMVEKYKLPDEKTVKAKKALLTDFFYKLCLIRNAKALAQGGSKVRCFYWDVRGDVEKLTANSISMVSTILGNSAIAEQMGYLNNRNITEISQALINKFIHGQAMELFNNEMKGVRELNWEEYAAVKGRVLHIERDSIKMSESAFTDNALELAKLLFDE